MPAATVVSKWHTLHRQMGRVTLAELSVELTANLVRRTADLHHETGPQFPFVIDHDNGFEAVYVCITGLRLIGPDQVEIYGHDKYLRGVLVEYNLSRFKGRLRFAE